MNLAASLGNNTAPRPARGLRIDCGNGLHLSVAEISARCGTKPSGIYQRIRKGQTGAELLRGPRTKLYDLGGERLSITDLCKRTGLSDGAMRSRIAKGWTGKELLYPRSDRRRKGSARSPTQHIAFKLAFAFGKRVPSTKEIKAVQPMSHTSAMRWRNAMRQALESLA